jgi:site-specific DNA-adenine methylase
MRTHNRRESINLKQNFHNRLKNVKILNTDYKKVIKDYNTENSFFYFRSALSWFIFNSL